MSDELLKLIKDFLNLYTVVGCIFIVALMALALCGCFYLISKTQESDEKRFKQRVKDIMKERD